MQHTLAPHCVAWYFVGTIVLAVTLVLFYLSVFLYRRYTSVHANARAQTRTHTRGRCCCAAPSDSRCTGSAGVRPADLRVRACMCTCVCVRVRARVRVRVRVAVSSRSSPTCRSSPPRAAQIGSSGLKTRRPDEPQQHAQYSDKSRLRRSVCCCACNLVLYERCRYSARTVQRAAELSQRKQPNGSKGSPEGGRAAWAFRLLHYEDAGDIGPHLRRD